MLKNMLKNIYHYFYYKFRKDIIYNIGKQYSLEQKKALVSYISYPYFNVTSSIFHSQVNEVFEIVNCLNKLGYSVDIIDNKSKSNISNNMYDLVVGFGEPFRLAKLKNSKSLRVAYLTENEPSFSLEQESIRISEFNKSKWCRNKAKVMRSGWYFKSEDLKYSNYALFFGNDFTIKTWGKLLPTSKIKLISPSGLKNSKFTESLVSNKNNNTFVWFGGSGAIHKGIDLLLSSFECLGNDFTLYLCGFDKKEQKLFKRLPENVIVLGKLNVESDEYLDLVDKCTFVILPSCSEAQSTGVLTCIRHGLIPVISNNVGLDVDGFGFLIKSLNADSIISTIQGVSNLTDLDISNLSKRCVDIGDNLFSIDSYSRNFETAMRSILNGD